MIALILLAVLGVPQSDAQKVFARAHALCEADAGKLWGVSLCVPMMLVDPTSREAVANTQVPGATADGTLFRLTLPANTQVANAPLDYQGTRLAELMYPMYGSSDMQAVTLMHESFHIVQPRLGFNGDADASSSISGDGFLDTENGRIWLRGELHALRIALRSGGAARTQAVGDALAMRLYRHTLDPKTAEAERQQDILEGLAESTGIDVGLPPESRVPYALYDMHFLESQPSYARAFAYATGPAYSELLDAARPDWRRAVTDSSDIAAMTMAAYGLHVAAPTAAQVQAIIARYDGAAIESAEATRAAQKAAQAKKYTQELIDGPTLTLPMAKFGITFNPRDIETFDPYGSIYHTLTVTSAWGAITVSGGDALIDANFKNLTVAAPATPGDGVVQGDGWKLQLAAGWSIAPDPKRNGSFIVVPSH